MMRRIPVRANPARFMRIAIGVPVPPNSLISCVDMIEHGLQETRENDHERVNDGSGDSADDSVFSDEQQEPTVIIHETSFSG
jgi:hypothetical protein